MLTAQNKADEVCSTNEAFLPIDNYVEVRGVIKAGSTQHFPSIPSFYSQHLESEVVEKS